METPTPNCASVESSSLMRFNILFFGAVVVNVARATTLARIVLFLHSFERNTNECIDVL